MNLRQRGCLIALVALVLTCGCKRSSPDSERPAATYTVQGIVKMMPPAAQPGNNKTIVVLHQAVPKFKDKAGQEVGMMAMPMPFTLSKDVNVTGIDVGSKVEFTFGVFWNAPTPTRILAIKKLPEDTQIHFNIDE